MPSTDPSTNATCFDLRAASDSPSLIQNGQLVIQACLIGWIVCGVSALLAVIISIWLVNKHLMWYTNENEQRYIVRILFLVPIYAIVSLGSIIFWNTSTPLLLVRDCYESTVLTSFFYLLLQYLSPDVNVQKDVFREVGPSHEADSQALRNGKEPRRWMFPLVFVKSKPEDGLRFLQMMKWGVLQYCVVRPTTTLGAIILNFVGLYCGGSRSPGWGYLCITLTVSISVTIAMYCLLQFYMPIAPFLKSKSMSVGLKIFAINAVIFLTFWQSILLSLLNVFGLVKSTQYITALDVDIGIGAVIETVEMAIFALIHVKAFSYKPYVISYPDTSSITRFPQSPSQRLRSLMHSFDFRETFIELWRGLVYLVVRWRGIEDDGFRVAKRRAMLREVFGRIRAKLPVNGDEGEKEPMKVQISIDVEEHVDEDGLWKGAITRWNRYNFDVDSGWDNRRPGSEEVMAEQMKIHLKGLSSNRSDTRHWLRDISSSTIQTLTLHHSRNPTALTQDNDNDSLIANQGSRKKFTHGSSWWRSTYEHIPGDALNGHEALEVYGINHARSNCEMSYNDPPPPSIIRHPRHYRQATPLDFSRNTFNARTSIPNSMALGSPTTPHCAGYFTQLGGPSTYANEDLG